MSAAQSPPTHPQRFIAGLGIAQIISWGSLIYAFPLLAGPMGQELGWSKPQTYLLASLALAMAGLAAYPVGSVIDRGRGRTVMAVGSALAGVSLLLWAMAGSAWLLVPAFIGIGVAQAMTLYDPAFAVIARRFGDKARDGITSLTLWGGFASTVFLPIVQGMLDLFGWRPTLVGLALFNLLLSLPLHLWLLRDDGVGGPAPRRLIADDRQTTAWALRQWVFWGLAVTFMLYFAAFTSVTFHLYPLLAERGMDAAHIVTIMAIIGPAQVAGRVVVMGIARALSIRVVGRLTTAALALSLLGLALAGDDFWLLALFALIYGGANGVLTIVRGAAVPEMLTARAYGSINGALSTPINIVRAAAPSATALLHAAFGSYDGVLAAWLVMAGMMMLVFWLTARLARPPEP